MSLARFLGISGVAMLLLFKSALFFGGVFFTASSIPAMVVFPLFLLSFLCYLIVILTLLVKTLKRKSSLSQFATNLVYLPVMVGLFYVPFPTQVDGMAWSLKRKVSQEQLFEFSRALASVNLQSDGFLKDAEMTKLSELFPDIAGLANFPARYHVEQGGFSMYWGSALVKHWGIDVQVQGEPLLRDLPEERYKQVYQGVWVWHDIW